MARMKAPRSGITVRMYRQGHGDCFLLATRKANGDPFYMVIDCGMKSKSEIKPENTIDVVIKDIETATGGRIDVVLITHEHEDHVNGFAAKPPRARTRTYWKDIKVGQIWLAWTEDGDDAFANELRERFDDTLLGLFGLRDKMAARPEFALAADQIEALLAFETGEEQPGTFLKSATEKVKRKNPQLSDRAALRVALRGRRNKEAMKYMREKAQGAPLFLRPDKGPYQLGDVDGIQVFPFGPPRSEDLLLSLNPRKNEEFKLSAGLDGPARSVFAAVADGADGTMETDGRPFRGRHGIALEALSAPRPAQQEDAQAYDFLMENYGAPEMPSPDDWRRIDAEWLGAGRDLALRLNSEVNNTSLVIAIQLPNTGKVLLFTGDAQRGSWISWADLSWETAPGQRVTARDLLARTVFYKVGHHGSHNATLSGTTDDPHPNLGWMAQGEFGDEFTAMIPSNEDWALARKPWPWKHPLKAIRAALDKKARGKVFQTNQDAVDQPTDVSDAEWQKFTSRSRISDLFIECTVFDD